MKNAKIRRLYHQIRNELLTFRNELNKLSVPDYPTELDKDIIKKLHKKVDDYEELLSKIISDINEDEKDDNIIIECKNKIITQIHTPLVKEDIKFLSWLSKAQTRRVPWSFVNCVEVLGRQILPGKQILVCCENRYNYEICWAKDTKVAPYPYYVISLPLLHRTNILWHALIGHELFHPRCSEFLNKHNKVILTEIRNTVAENPNEFLPDRDYEDAEHLFSKQEKEELLAAISDIIHFAWRRGLQEILCDMACVEIFGPAGLLAMKAFSACSAKNSIPEPANNFYPSWQYRFEIVWKYFIDEKKLERLCSNIKNEQISSSFKAEIATIKALAEKTERDKLVKSHKLARIAYSKIDKVLSSAVDFVKSTLPSNIRKWHETKILNQVPELVDRLENGVPPNEVIVEICPETVKYSTEGAFLPAILIAGWIYESYWQEKYDQNQDIMKYKTMSRLLLKACEDIEIISKIQNVGSDKKNNTK